MIDRDREPGPLVLMYHGIDPGDGRYSRALAAELAYVVKQRDFVDHLDALAAAGRRVVDPAEWLERGGELRPGEVLLTFDDGWRSDYDVVLPLLLERGCRGLFFVTTGPVAEPGRATWGEWRKMVRAGMTLGSHGVTHRFLSKISADELDAELRGSREAIEKETGARVATLSCPGGRWNTQVAALAGQLGYRAVFTSAPDPPAWQGGVAVVGRVAVRADWDGESMGRFLAKQPAALRRMRRMYRMRAVAQRVLRDRFYEVLHALGWRVFFGDTPPLP